MRVVANDFTHACTRDAGYRTAIDIIEDPT
jgi:hypothetical protein